ncbi:hypothetical protein PC128_g27179 [Phytophthora cactorum]|nr:hypothetical protein PC128_g27179 [Phytophthora cactorum]
MLEAAMMFVPHERAPLAETLIDVLFDFLIIVGPTQNGKIPRMSSARRASTLQRLKTLIAAVYPHSNLPSMDQGIYQT